MNDYVIITDSSADLSEGLVKELGVEVLPLSFTIQGKTYHNYPDNREMAPEEFYRLIREGEMGTTAAVNVAEYTDLMDPVLASGKDVLVLAFSSGLSATYQSSKIAVDEMAEKYPDRKVYTVDTLCASLGQGLFVYLAAKLRAEGKTIDEVRDWAEENKLNVCHWVAVDDLAHLKRGGRISATTAFLGGMLSIKPIIHVDNEGKLINVGKTRGRAASLDFLVEKAAERMTDPAEQTVFISHSDCLEDAMKVGEGIKERTGAQKVIYNFIGPVIGSHTGTGTVALFFLGSER